MTIAMRKRDFEKGHEKGKERKCMKKKIRVLWRRLKEYEINQNLKQHNKIQCSLQIKLTNYDIIHI